MSTSAGASPQALSINGTMPAWAERADGNPLLAFVDSCLRGVGQVCFMNNPVTGLAILGAMFVGEAWLGFAGALGLAVSTLTAIWIGMDRRAIRAGLFGFNGVLVGAGMSLFLQPDWDALVMVTEVRACEHTFVSSQGSAYARFRRALKTSNLLPFPPPHRSPHDGSGGLAAACWSARSQDRARRVRGSRLTVALMARP